MRITIAILAICALTSACSKTPVFENESNNQALRAMSEDEKLKDFDALVDSFRQFYGPLEYKEKRFGFKLDDLANEYRQKIKATTSDIEAYSFMVQFAARFQDGHVSVQSAMMEKSYYATPIRIAPFEKKALIVAINDKSLEKSLGISVGDEILTVDGRSPFDYLPIVEKYMSYGNPYSTRHVLDKVLNRPAFMTELRPAQSHVALKIEKADGTAMERTLLWELKNETSYSSKVLRPDAQKDMLFSEKAAALKKGSALDMASETPFFMTPQVKAGFRPTQIKPSAEALKRHGVEDPKKVPELFAALYKFQGKTILILRQASYSIPDPKERIAWFKALLEEYVAMVDVIVVDQTHNPGGSLSYAMDFMALFADQKSKSIVNLLNGDRIWLDFFGTQLAATKETRKNHEEDSKGFEHGFKLVEQAYDSGGGLTKEAISLTGYNYVTPQHSIEGRPVLVLINELAGSCGDIFPKLMQVNNLGTLFGKTTMGLGGNVESVLKLPYSRVEVGMTRGLFVPYSPDGIYPESDMVENNGVRPDIEHEVTAQDFRKGYTKYFEAFSKAAIGLVKK